MSEPTPHAGPVNEVKYHRNPKPGDTVLIPKGARITGTHSSLPKHAGRAYTVKVNWYDEHNGVVTWAGTGGYWHRTIEWTWP